MHIGASVARPTPGTSMVGKTVSLPASGTSARSTSGEAQVSRVFWARPPRPAGRRAWSARASG